MCFVLVFSVTLVCVLCHVMQWLSCGPGFKRRLLADAPHTHNRSSDESLKDLFIDLTNRLYKDLVCLLRYHLTMNRDPETVI